MNSKWILRVLLHIGINFKNLVLFFSLSNQHALHTRNRSETLLCNFIFDTSCSTHVVKHRTPG